MKISGITYDSIVDGEGIRNTIFVSGCLHKCNHCHNKQTWDFNYGYNFDETVQNEFIKRCKSNILLDGLTISGGDPMYCAENLIPFVKKYKKELPNHSIWIYSGFTYEEILKNNCMSELMFLCDVLVDGMYVEELRDITLNFRGSKNQRIINLK